MKLLALIISLFLFASFQQSEAQDEKIRTYLQLVASGKLSEVKMALPDLLAEYPSHPGVMILHGIVIEDGEKAVGIYQKIVRQFPQSEWADDAYWRIIQYFAIKGDLETARLELENFRKSHPTSEFLSPATDVVRTAERMFSNKSSNNPTQDFAQNNRPQQNKEQQEATKELIINKEKSESVVKQSDSKENLKNTETTYGLQVGIYSTREAAESEKERFYRMRMNTEVMKKDIDGQTKFAVVIGEYSSVESAEHAKKVVQLQCKCNPIIFKR